MSWIGFMRMVYYVVRLYTKYTSQKHLITLQNSSLSTHFFTRLAELFMETAQKKEDVLCFTYYQNRSIISRGEQGALILFLFRARVAGCVGDRWARSITKFELKCCDTAGYNIRLLKLINRLSAAMHSNQLQEFQLVKKIQNYAFNLSDKVGEGSFSQVYRATNLTHQTTVAVKKVRVADLKSKIAARLLRCETTLLPRLSHPNIIKCLDIHFSVNNCYIITQYCEGGNLDTYLKQHKLLPEHEIRKIVSSLYHALQYLSNLGIVHRDLKLSNIFLQNGHYKLGDFGFAIEARLPFRDVSIGSPLYMSPEGLIHHVYGPKTDIWSFGILIYELLHGKTPLQTCRTEEELRKKVLQPPFMRADISVELRELIQGCLRIEEKERLNIVQIGQSSYIRRLKQEAEIQQKVQKDMSLAEKTTETTHSEKSAVSQISKEKTVSFMSIESAIALLNFTKLVHRLSKLSSSTVFRRCLFWLTRKLLQSTIKSSYKGENEAQIYDTIKQQSQKITNQQSFTVYEQFKLEEVKAECESMILKESKWALQFKLLSSECEYLMKAEAEGSWQYFVKKSKAKQYLATISSC